MTDKKKEDEEENCVNHDLDQEYIKIPKTEFAGLFMSILKSNLDEFRRSE